MPADLRLALQIFRTARLNGLIWLATAFVLFGSLIIGFRWNLLVLGRRFSYNPVYWFVVMALCLSAASLYWGDTYPALNLPVDIGRWMRLDPVLAASTSLIRRTFLRIQISNTLLIAATLLYAATAVFGLVIGLMEK